MYACHFVYPLCLLILCTGTYVYMYIQLTVMVCPHTDLHALDIFDELAAQACNLCPNDLAMLKPHNELYKLDKTAVCMKHALTLWANKLIFWPTYIKKVL